MKCDGDGLRNKFPIAEVAVVLSLPLAGAVLLFWLSAGARAGNDITLEVEPYPLDTSITSTTSGASSTSSSGGAPLQVTAMTPVPDSTINGKPGEIDVTLSHAVLPQSVNAKTVKLFRAGGDGTFDDGNEVEIPLAGLALTTPTTIRLTLTGAAMPNDKYRVKLLASPTTPSSTSSSSGGSTSTSSSGDPSSSTSNSSTSTSNTSNSTSANSSTSNTSSASSNSSTSTSTASGATSSGTSSSGGTSSGDGTFPDE